MNNLPPCIPICAALVWIGSRDFGATWRAVELRSDLEIAVAIRVADVDPVTRVVIEQQPDEEAKEVPIVSRGEGPRQLLQRQLESGAVKAFGDLGTGRMEQIIHFEWLRMKIGLGNYVLDEDGRKVRSVKIDTTSLMHIFPGNAEGEHVSADGGGQYATGGRLLLQTAGNIMGTLERRHAVNGEQPRRRPGRPKAPECERLRAALRARAEADPNFGRSPELKAWIEMNFSISKSSKNTALREVLGSAKNSTKKSAEQ
jgi:hypothetical protein